VELLALFGQQIERNCFTYLGASHPLEPLGKGKRGTPTVREETRLYGETKRRHLGLPILHVK